LFSATDAVSIKLSSDQLSLIFPASSFSILGREGNSGGATAWDSPLVTYEPKFRDAVESSDQRELDA
jgi:hypothetical protein